MPSAIEEMSSAVVKDAPITLPADVAPAPAAPAPAPTPEPPKPAAAPTPPPAPEKPTEAKPTALQKASDKMARIVGDKKPDAKPKADKPKADAPDEEVEKHIKSNPNAWRVYEAKKKAWAEKEAGFTTKTAELEKKIAELSAKPNPTVADDAKLKVLEERLAARETEYKTVKQQLVERDYTQSDEYKEKFIKPWQNAHKEAYDFVKGLQVVDENGDAVRQATEADFEKVKATPLQQRRAVARALFGEDSAGDVVDYAKEIDRLVKGSNEAIAEHSKDWEKTAQEKAMVAQKEREGFTKLEQDERATLEKDFPDYFSVEHHKDNPEYQKALADAYSEYDAMLNGFSEKTPAEQAASKVVARAYYAAFPLMYKQVTALKSQVESLTAELTKLRGTDPGSVKPGTVTTPPADEIGGINQMAGKFKG
jgi:hypothetical protein